VDASLRSSAAHVLVVDVERPVPASDDVHHLLRVLRLRDGESVSVTDGAGRWRLCAVAGGNVEPVGVVHTEPPPAPTLTIAVAPPKGDRLEWLVAKCTEAGIDRIVLLDAERSVVRWSGDRAVKQLARLRRVASEASMQSRRVWWPEIAGPVPAREMLDKSRPAEPGGRAVTAGDVGIAVGPEGGWSPTELDGIDDTVSLGPHVLRVETAAVVATGLMIAARA